jgi:hypothetical protein
MLRHSAGYAAINADVGVRDLQDACHLPPDAVGTPPNRFCAINRSELFGTIPPEPDTSDFGRLASPERTFTVKLSVPRPTFASCVY